MSYVNHIVTLFGGIRPMARAVGRPASTVSSWNERGSIPDREKPHVLEAATEQGIDLRPEHFFPGFGEAEDEKGAA